ncbi:MAG: RagB/SusD family nutrient uptake outer membrane protein [Arachidicoccus sp.]|nr:RagB/SusD family nutrient uptake outer membrane protein [Arachidicoccus sp.]
MKPSIKTAGIFIIFTGISVFIFSCKKLSENPQSSLTPDEFFQTQADAISAVTSVYSTLVTDINNDFPIYGRNLNLLIDNTSDEEQYSPSNTNPDVRALGTATYVNTNDRVHKIYAQLYWGIDKANLAIDGIQTIPDNLFTNYNKNNLIREARFIRALYYFNLVRLFGGVPLVLHDANTIANANNLPSRTSKDSVYLQIIEDLDSATNLPATQAGANTGRVTSGAAYALLGKVYATKHDWADAATALKKVITVGTAGLSGTGNYGYDLFPKYSDIFLPASKNGKEHIFSAQFNANIGGGFTATSTLSGFSWSNAAYLADVPWPLTTDANALPVKLFNINDQRRSATFYDSLFNSSTNAWVKWPYFNYLKWVDLSVGFTSTLTGSSQANAKVNFPVIRYTDVLLLYAEVLNEINNGPTAEAYAAINIVRARAYAPITLYDPKTVSFSSYNYSSNGNYTDHTFDLSGLNYLQFKDSVYEERNRELFFEANRWFDLVRRVPDAEYASGQFYLTKVQAQYGNPKASASLKDTLFPIPYTEIQLYQASGKTYPQNPGWE